MAEWWREVVDCICPPDCAPALLLQAFLLCSFVMSFLHTFPPHLPSTPLLYVASSRVHFTASSHLHFTLLFSTPPTRFPFRLGFTTPFHTRRSFRHLTSCRIRRDRHRISSPSLHTDTLVCRSRYRSGSIGPARLSLYVGYTERADTKNARRWQPRRRAGFPFWLWGRRTG